MWVAVFLTILASAGNNVGRALQKKGTRGLPRLILDRKVVLQYLLNRTWSSGLAIDVAGALLMVVAVSQAPVSVVQPVAGAGLAILAVFSHFYLGERLQMGEWVAVALALVGTIGVGATAQAPPAGGVTVPRIVAGLVSCVALLAVGTVWLNRKSSSKDHSFAGSRIESILVGMQAGACFGLSAVACRTGFLLAESGHHTLVAVPTGLAASVMLTSSGFFCQTRGLKDGNAVVVSTCAAVASIVSGAVVGMLALGEHVPRTLEALLSWSCIFLGVAALAAGAAGGTAGGAAAGVAKAVVKRVLLPDLLVDRVLPIWAARSYRAVHKKPENNVGVATKV